MIDELTGALNKLLESEYDEEKVKKLQKQIKEIINDKS
jgi:hypothetical protein